jgi:cell division protein ZapA
MNNAKLKPVNLHILNKEYVVACPEEEYDTLNQASRYLNQKVQEIREGGKVVSNERVVVVSALNIVHEFFQYKQEHESIVRDLNRQIKQLQDKIDIALNQMK